MPEVRIPTSVQRKLASGAHQSERAIVVGNRAGVIEWANDAWTRVTGYPLDDSTSKPVTSFLAGVDVDPGVVDFVAGCFGQGRVCELELPLTPPGRKQLWVQLRVEPLFDARGEVSDFIASATDITERKQAEQSGRLIEVDLSSLAARAVVGQQALVGDTVGLDVELARGLPLVLADEEGVEALVARLIARGSEAIGGGWGTVTVWTGILGDSLGPIHSRNLWPGLPEGHWLFLEVHDTGSQPGGNGSSRVTEPFLTTRSPGHAMRYAEAESRLRAQGAELRMESDFVDGTSVVLLFPVATDDSGWLAG